MRARFCFVLTLAVALPLCPAQAPAKAPPELTLTLYREAKADLRSVPAPVEPQDLLAIATAEAIHHSKLADADFAQAFRDALALPAPAPDAADDPTARWNEYTKRFVEEEAIVRLSQAGPAAWSVAHNLARQADVPRGQLYTELIAAANNWARAKAGAHQPLEQGLLARTFGGIGYIPKVLHHPPTSTPPYNVLELAQECYQADGTFPYLGVMIALEDYHAAETDQRPLVLLAYQAASQETHPRGLYQTLGIFMMGHRLYPALDPQLESALIAELGNLQKAVAAPENSRWKTDLLANGNALLALLTKLDSARGADLSAQYSMFSLPAKDLRAPLRKFSDLTANQRRQNADPAAALSSDEHLPALSDAQKEAKFRALLSLAIHLAINNPAPAATAASDALDLLTPQLLQRYLRRVALLAMRMKVNLHEPGKAETLTAKCLDAAESIADAKETAFDNAGAAQQFHLADDFTGDGAPEVDMWAYASQVDVHLALARAQQTSAGYFKPLFLERIAVGQEMLHPWWK